MQEIAMQNKDKYPKASHEILKNFYVDDLLTGANTIEDLEQIKYDIKGILSNAQFTLRK